MQPFLVMTKPTADSSQTTMAFSGTGEHQMNFLRGMLRSTLDSLKESGLDYEYCEQKIMFMVLDELVHAFGEGTIAKRAVELKKEIDNMNPNTLKYTTEE